MIEWVFIRNIEDGDRIHIGRGLSPAVVDGHCIRVPVDGVWTYMIKYREDEGRGPARELRDADPLRRVGRFSQGGLR